MVGKSWLTSLFVAIKKTIYIVDVLVMKITSDYSVIVGDHCT